MASTGTKRERKAQKRPQSRFHFTMVSRMLRSVEPVVTRLNRLWAPTRRARHHGSHQDTRLGREVAYRPRAGDPLWRKVRGKGCFLAVTSEFGLGKVGWMDGGRCGHVDPGRSAVYVPWLRLADKGRAKYRCITLGQLRHQLSARVFLFFPSHRPHR